MPNVQFYLKPESPISKTRLVYMLVRYTTRDLNLKTQEHPKGFPTYQRLVYTWDCKLTAGAKWNPKKQEINAGPDEIKNKELQRFKRAFNDAWNERDYMEPVYYREKLEAERYKNVTPAEAKPVDLNKMTLFKFMQERINKTANAGTRQTLETDLHYLEKKYPEMDFNTFNADFIQKFKSERGVAISSLNIYLRRLKMIVAKALKAGHMTLDPFADYTFEKKNKIKSKKRIALTDEQFDKIKAVELPAHLENTRKMFLVMAWTGLRYSDARAIKRENIDHDGVGYLFKITTKKTGEEVEIPVNPKIIEMFPNLVFPELPEESAQFNERIKLVIKKAEIDTKGLAVSSHQGRISFITNNIDRMEIGDLMKIVGHLGQEMTRHYDKRNSDKAVKSLRETFAA